MRPRTTLSSEFYQNAPYQSQYMYFNKQFKNMLFDCLIFFKCLTIALSTISNFRSLLSLVQYIDSTCLKLRIWVYECKTWLLKYLLFWTLFFKGPVRISPQNARSMKDKGGTKLHGPNTCAFVISKVQHDLMLTSKVNH